MLCIDFIDQTKLDLDSEKVIRQHVEDALARLKEKNATKYEEIDGFNINFMILEQSVETLQ